MEELKKHTPTVLLKLINDAHAEHEKIKQEISNYTIEVDKLEAKINEKLNLLTETEKKWVELIEELNSR